MRKDKDNLCHDMMPEMLFMFLKTMPCVLLPGLHHVSVGRFPLLSPAAAIDTLMSPTTDSLVT